MHESELISNRILQYKHYFNEHPEIGWEEAKTTKYIKDQLNGISIIEGLGINKTGAVFVIGRGEKNVFVRADIDALKTSTEPRHLCGHSTHAAALMGAYHWLSEHESDLTARGKQVTFIFQPAEEVFPSGAKTLIETYPELLQRSQYGFAVHVRPNIPLDTIQVQPGPTWAANDIIQIIVKGFSAHIKDTPKGIDAIEGASHIVRLFREYQQEFPTFGKDIVFNFNVIRGGISSNSVADNVFLKGAVRWTKKEDQQRLINFFRKLPSILKVSYPGDVEIEYIPEVPPTCENDPT